MRDETNRLSALDAMFVGIETSQLHMHVGAVLVLESGALETDAGGVDFDRISQFLDKALESYPIYRQRLRKTPGLRHPVWVDDEHFRLLYHLRHTALPAPGGMRQLKRLAGRIFSQALDKRRPLWELWVVEGLAKDKFALIIKVHHALVDGMAGMAVLASLLRPTPNADFEPLESPWRPRKEPSPYELFQDEYRYRREGLASLVRRGREYYESLKQGGSHSGAVNVATGLLRIAEMGLSPAPKTSINPKEVSPHRRFDVCSFELAKIKTIKNQLGGKINDAMLALCAGGLRRFLARRGDDVSTYSNFRILMPVSTRSAGQHGGNQVALTLVPMPLHIEDPHERYEAIVREAHEVKKSSGQVEGVALIEEVADVSFDGLLRETVKLAGALRPFNVVITNVPGPPFPLYLLGARVEEMVPLVPLFHHQGLGIALFSYDGTMTVGFGADWHAIDDLHLLAQDFGDSFDELYTLATGEK